MLVHRRRERQLPHCSTHCRVGKHSLSAGYIQSLHMHICINVYIYINTRLSNKSENYIFSYIPLVIYIYISQFNMYVMLFIQSQLYQVLISQPHNIFLNSKLKQPVVLQIVQANVQGECARFVHAPLACFVFRETGNGFDEFSDAIITGFQRIIGTLNTSVMASQLYNGLQYCIL